MKNGQNLIAIKIYILNTHDMIDSICILFNLIDRINYNQDA